MAYFTYNISAVNKYWITVKQSGILVSNAFYHYHLFYHYHYHLSMPINDVKVLKDCSDILQIIFTSNKVFYFSQIIVFMAYYLSKIYPQSERKMWFYLAQNFRFFISKAFEFLFKKGVISSKQLLLNFKVIKRNKFQFSQNL